jgi:hypothetical protein
MLMYILVVSIIISTKPALMFQADGTPKKWGSVIDESTSVFALAFTLPLTAFICYFVAAMLEMIMS